MNVRYLAYPMLPVPLIVAVIATINSRGRGAVQQPPWVEAALIIAGIYMAIAVPSLFVCRRLLAGPRGDVVRAKGINPDDFLILGGTCVFFVPTGVTLLLTPVGLEIGYTYMACAFSTCAMVAWVVFYRPIRRRASAA